ncbi:MAG: hypothetical protein F4Y30_07895 [Chloroflexi bacterium]|nr:hypothetical protein [Chloroflexota bacterium]MYI41057.1 hypothetical protein [Chloroflexota bacterium]
MSDKKESDKPKRSVGRPPLQFPSPIDVDPADMVKSAFKLNTGKVGFEWQYLKDAGKPQKRK